MREIGAVAREVLLDVVPRSTWLTFSEVFAAFLDEYGSAHTKTVYRYLARLEAEGKVRVALEHEGQPKRIYRRA